MIVLFNQTFDSMFIFEIKYLILIFIDNWTQNDAIRSVEYLIQNVVSKILEIITWENLWIWIRIPLFC
jgi:hypothetical protein